MIETKNVLSISYEGKSEQIPICSSIKELEQEFINKFKAEKNNSYCFYYKINSDIDIILTQDSFSDFIELNIMTLFADKKKENIIGDDISLNEKELNSGLDLFIQEIKNQKSKLKLVKNKFIQSKEIELNYKLVNENSSEKHIINDMKLKLNELIEENNKLKERKERQSIIKETKVISLQYNGQNKEKKEIELLKNEINELRDSNNNLKTSFENKEKELIKKNIELTNDNSKLKNENENLNNINKNLEYIKEKLNKEIESLKARIERYKKIIAELREEKINSELEAPKQIEINNNVSNASNIAVSPCSSNGSTKLDSMYKSDSSRKEKKIKKIKLINKLYQELKEKNLNRTKNNIDSFSNLDNSVNEDLNESQVVNNNFNKTKYEESIKNKFFAQFREKFSKFKKNK